MLIWHIYTQQTQRFGVDREQFFLLNVQILTS